MSVPLARRNLAHHKGKLLLHVLGIAATLALILILFGFREGMYGSISAYADHLDADVIIAQEGVTGFFSSRSSIPASLHEPLAESAGATEIEHVLISSIILTHADTKTPILLIGYDTESGIGGPWKMGQGRLLQADDEILLDTWLAERIGVTIGYDLEVLGRTFEVVGLTRETASWMSPYVFISQQAAADLFQMEDGVSYYLLRLPDGASLVDVEEQLEAEYEQIDALQAEDITTADRQILASTMDRPISLILVIGIVIGIAVMGLTTYTAVMERVREYGVLKAVGANHWWLMRLVLAETLYRTALGYAVGIGLSYLTAEWMMRAWPQFLITIQPTVIPLVGGLALVMAVAAALLPTRRVLRIDPALVFRA